MDFEVKMAEMYKHRLEICSSIVSKQLLNWRFPKRSIKEGVIFF